MKKNKVIGVIVAAGLTVGIGAAFAKDNPQADKAGEYKSSQDSPRASGVINEAAGANTGTYDKEKFIKETAQNGIAEVNMAKLGTQKAQDPEVKEFAQKLVADHSKLNDEVKELASKKGIALATEVDSKHQQMIDHLSSLSGAEFDKAFAMHMAKGHKKSIANFKKASTNNDDTEVRTFAKNALPILEEHLRMAQKWAPDSSAGVAVEEPSGAKSEQKDDASATPQYKNKDLDDSSKTPDAPNPE